MEKDGRGSMGRALEGFFSQFGAKKKKQAEQQPQPQQPVQPKQGSDSAKAFVKGFKKALD